MRLAFDVPPSVAELAAAEAAEPVARELLAAALADFPKGPAALRARDLLARVLLLQGKPAAALDQWERAEREAGAAELYVAHTAYAERAVRCRELLGRAGQGSTP